MAGFVVTKKLTREEADDFWAAMVKFFYEHPDRVDCVVSFCDDDRFTWLVRRGSITRDVAKHAMDGWEPPA